MKKYIQYRNLLFNFNVKNNASFLEKLKATFGMDATFSLWEIEAKIYAAHLASTKAIELREKFSKILRENPLATEGVLWLNTEEKFELEAYEYLFFCAARKVYKELEFLKDYAPQYSQEIEELLRQLEHLKDQRDGMEHGTEENWKVFKGKVTDEKNLKRKASKGDNFDFNKNMVVMDKVYDFILSKLL